MLHDAGEKNYVHCTLPTHVETLIIGAKFVDKRKNVATSYFQSKKKIIPKQSRWKYFRSEFDYVLGYKTGRGNIMDDTLIWKSAIASISTTHCEMKDSINDGMQPDLEAKKLM